MISGTVITVLSGGGGGGREQIALSRSVAGVASRFTRRDAFNPPPRFVSPSVAGRRWSSVALIPSRERCWSAAN